jgi:metal-responsive CopG/Arc/MetJ family transcriptional regulator
LRTEVTPSASLKGFQVFRISFGSAAITACAMAREHGYENRSEAYRDLLRTEGGRRRIGFA